MVWYGSWHYYYLDRLVSVFTFAVMIYHWLSKCYFHYGMLFIYLFIYLFIVSQFTTNQVKIRTLLLIQIAFIINFIFILKFNTMMRWDDITLLIYQMTLFRTIITYFSLNIILQTVLPPIGLIVEKVLLCSMCFLDAHLWWTTTCNAWC